MICLTLPSFDGKSLKQGKFMPKKNEKTKASKPAKAAKATKAAKAPAAKTKSTGLVTKAVKGLVETAKRLTATKAAPAPKKAAAGKAAAPAKPVKGAKAAPTPAVVAPAKGAKGKGTAPVAAPAPVAAKGKKAKGEGSSKKASLLNSCREVACESTPTSAGYCRPHYIKNWKKIKRKEAVLKDGRLNQYVEELINKYPEKYIEAIRHDLANDKEFMKVIRDLELDETIDDLGTEEAESIEGVVENVATSRRGADLEDEGDIF